MLTQSLGELPWRERSNCDDFTNQMCLLKLGGYRSRRGGVALVPSVVTVKLSGERYDIERGARDKPMH